MVTAAVYGQSNLTFPLRVLRRRRIYFTAMATPAPCDAAMMAEVEAEMDSTVAAAKAAESGQPTGVPTVASGETDVASDSQAPTDATEAAPQPVPALATCAKCKTDGLEVADMICREGYRVELRYVCKACHATQASLARKGINVQKLLGEQHLVQFFSEAAVERRNASENRLSFGQSRALLRKTMVQEVLQIKKDSQESEWQPLSYWELKGYNTEKIERDCPREDHPILGATYKLSIHHESEGTVVKDCEARITEMENDAMQRRSAATHAPGVPHSSTLRWPSKLRRRNAKALCRRKRRR